MTQRERSFYAGQPDYFLTAICVVGYVVAAALIATMGIATLMRIG